jgi:hypothetical protein
MESVTQIIEEVAEKMCTNYCKWPDLWDEEAEGMELCDSNHCKNCPLNRLN